MTTTLDLLVRDFVEWVAREPRSYTVALDAWRTSCPCLTVWEDALDRGLVETKPNLEGRGRFWLRRPMAQGSPGQRPGSHLTKRAIVDDLQTFQKGSQRISIDAAGSKLCAVFLTTNGIIKVMVEFGVKLAVKCLILASARLQRMEGLCGRLLLSQGL